MSFSRVAENKIREAIAEGKFDSLPNAGQPLNLDEYFSTPEELRMAFSILKNARCAPAEVELLKEIGTLREALSRADDQQQQASLRQTLSDRETTLAVLLERRAQRDR